MNSKTKKQGLRSRALIDSVIKYKFIYLVFTFIFLSETVFFDRYELFVGARTLIFPNLIHIIILLIVIIPILIVLHRKNDKLIITKNELIKSNNKYVSVVNNLKEVVFQTDENGIWTFLNPSWTEITGFSLEESIGKSFLDYVYSEDKEMNTKLFQPLIDRKKEYCRHEIRYITKQEGFRWIEVFARLTLDDENNVIGTSGTLTDITTRKSLELELYKKDILLQGITNASNMLLETNDYSKSFNNALDILGRVTDVGRVYIFENHFDNENKDLLTSQRFEWCKKGISSQMEELQNISFRELGLDWWLRKISLGETINGIVKNLPKAERSVLEMQGIISILVVPIFVDNKLWGFVGFDECKKEKIWTQTEVSTLSSAAASIGSAIKRMLAEDKLQRTIENDFREIIKKSNSLAFKCKVNDKGKYYFSLFGGNLLSDMGLANDYFYLKTVEEVFGDDYENYLKEYFDKAFEGQTTNFEFKYRNKYFYTTLFPIIKKNEIVEIIGSTSDISELNEAKEMVFHMAYHDSLTGLLNREYLKIEFDKIRNEVELKNEKIGLIFMDIDRFKTINDTLGHNIGDILLKNVADRLVSEFKDVNIISRMSGDEFIILKKTQKISEIERLAKDILMIFKESFKIEEYELFITPSIGISIYPLNGEDFDTLIKNADTAMYRVKEQGRNNFQFYESRMSDKVKKELSLGNYLRKALENREFFLQYQPRIDIGTGDIVGMEALLRWKNQDLGLISPLDFISLAEEMGLIIPIGKWVLYEACIQNKKLHDMGYKISISVNISARQVQGYNLVRTVKEVLKKTELLPEYLELEITENSLMRNADGAVEVINQLKELGVHISIDDFGTGFSSLSYLKRFQPNTLKIDKSFIRDIPSDENDSSIVVAIINMSQSLNIQVVAEGVENFEQLRFLKNNGCDEIQGYLFSKPVNILEIQAMLKKRNEEFFLIS